jgi:uncharacterized membrane protein
VKGWDVVRELHLLAMAFFVGGQLFLAAAVVPALRGAGDRGPLRRIARSFGYGTLIAIGVLLVTGAAMAGHYHQWSSGTLHIKLALVAVTAGLIVWHMRRPEQHAVEGLVFVLSLAIVWCGIVLSHG